MIASFVVIAFMADLGPWIHGISSYQSVCAGTCQDDPLQGAWFLGLTPYSILHLQDPFLTHVINYPSGVNMMNNTFVPLLGLLASPVTIIWGSVASFNVLVVLAFASSATAALFAFRRWTSWAPAAYVGALLYGFSPYMVAQGVSKLQLLVVPFPPLVLILLDEILVRQRLRARWIGAVLGLVVAAQVYLSTEVLGMTFVETVIGIALLLVFRWREVSSRVRYAVKALTGAVVTGLVLAAYPLWVFLWGPEHLNGPPHDMAALSNFQSDLVSVFLPSFMQRINPSGIQSISNALTPPQLWSGETGAYIGIPLFLIFCFVAVRFWRVGIVRFAAAMGVATLILTFGATFYVDGHSTGIPLPFRVFSSLPFLDSLFASRFTLFVELFGGLLLAVGLDRLHAEGWGRLRAGRPAAIAALALAVVGLVPLLPAWPYAYSSTGVPAYFTSAAAKAIPTNSTVLTYPFPRFPFVQPMYWQAVDGFRYDLPGGYITTPGPTFGTEYGTPSFTESFLTACEQGQGPLSSASEGVEASADLREWDVSTVVVTRSAPDPQCAIQFFDAVLSRAPVNTSSVWVWYGVQSDLGPSSP
jgi:hypothetical protein